MSGMIRAWKERKKLRKEEDILNDAFAVRLHAAYRNTVEDGWEDLIAKKRDLEAASVPASVHERRKDKMPAGRHHFVQSLAVAALVLLVIGLPILLVLKPVRPKSIWISIPLQEFRIHGGDSAYAFIDRFLDGDGIDVPQDVYPPMISTRLALRMEIARGEDVLFVVRYFYRPDAGEVVIGIGILPRETILEMAEQGYRLMDYYVR